MIELHPDDFPILIAMLRRVPVNHLFARSVIERQVDGRAWVDRTDKPRLAHVIHPYGMTLLFGSADIAGPQALKEHLLDCRRCDHDQWMQASLGMPVPALDDLLDAEAASADREPGGPRVQRYTRTNFRFDPARYAQRRMGLPPLRGAVIRPIAQDDFALPDISVSPHRFWRDFGQFNSHGGGWCVERNGELASMAFSSFRFDEQLEIGVETRAQCRGLGYALHATSAMLDQCLAAELEPLWSCRKENAGSYRLAIALGFEPFIEIAYYRLPAIGH